VWVIDPYLGRTHSAFGDGLGRASPNAEYRDRNLPFSLTPQDAVTAASRRRETSRRRHAVTGSLCCNRTTACGEAVTDVTSSRLCGAVGP
jgi:hypothetical protein